MALDVVGLGMIAGYVKGASILCLGYPDITAEPKAVKALLGVEPIKFTQHGSDHGVERPLPETVDTFMRAGAELVDCVDKHQTRGVERRLDLNLRQEWPRKYRLVINPGTLEHCFDIAMATFNAWRAVELGGFILQVAPLSMMNHGFWNVNPTAIVDFAMANGGTLMQIAARDRDWHSVPIELTKRFRVPPECVLYALVRKDAEIAERVPVQSRYR